MHSGLRERHGSAGARPQAACAAGGAAAAAAACRPGSRRAVKVGGPVSSRGRGWRRGGVSRPMVVNPFVRATRAGGACVRGPVHAEMVDPEVATVGGPALERAEARLAASTALGMARGAVALYECCVGSRVRPVPSSRCGGLEGDCGGGRGWVAYPASSPASVGTSCGSSVTCRVLGSSGRGRPRVPAPGQRLVGSDENGVPLPRLPGPARAAGPRPRWGSLRPGRSWSK